MCHVNCIWHCMLHFSPALHCVSCIVHRYTELFWCLADANSWCVAVTEDNQLITAHNLQQSSSSTSPSHNPYHHPLFMTKANMNIIINATVMRVCWWGISKWGSGTPAACLRRSPSPPYSAMHNVCIPLCIVLDFTTVCIALVVQSTVLDFTSFLCPAHCVHCTFYCIAPLCIALELIMVVTASWYLLHWTVCKAFVWFTIML